MTVSAENFLKEPDKYLQAAKNRAVSIQTEYGGAVLLSAEEYEDFELLKAMEEAEEDLAVGHFYTMEDFDKLVEAKVVEWEAKE
ncbi:MAG: hypothetical protein FWD58_09420 [Firmicutes bacterium]|nr:hypothetical protein [Bacillota bacterium]